MHISETSFDCLFPRLVLISDIEEGSGIMNNNLHPYIVYTDGLSPDERQSLIDFLGRIAFMEPSLIAKTIGPNPSYVVYCRCPVGEFASLPFPVKFRWKDASGLDLSALL